MAFLSSTQSFLRPTYLNVHRTYGCPANPDRCRPQCHVCGKDFSQPQKLKAHIEAEHAGSDFGHCGTHTTTSLLCFLCWGGRERKEVDLHFTNDSSHSTTPSFACPFKKFSDSSQDSETPTTFPTLFSVPVT